MGVRIYKRALEVQEIQALLEPGREAGLALNPPQQKPQEFTLSFNDREFRAMHQQPAFLAVRLPAGAVNIGAKAANGGSSHKIVLTPIVPESKLGVGLKDLKSVQLGLVFTWVFVEIAAVHSHP